MTEPLAQTALRARPIACDCGASASLDPLLTTEDVAAYLRVSVDTVYAWRMSGAGPKGYRFGKHLRFCMEDLLSYVATKRER